MTISSEKLLNLMGEKCIGLKSLSRTSGVTINTLVKLTKGENKKVRIETIGKLARALGCTIADLKA